MFNRRELALSAGASATLAMVPRASGQVPMSPDDLFVTAGRYLPRYLELRKQYQDRPDDLALAGVFAQYSAFIGAEDFPSTYEPANAVGPFEAPLISRPALEAIYEAAAGARLVILNEAHHVPGHRHFLLEVLKTLRPLGYRALAAEAFYPHQSEPMAKIEDYREGEPFLHQYGFYTKDPVFSETLRQAVALGYRLFSYEQSEGQQSPEGADRRTRISTREAAQAANALRVIRNLEADEGIVLYCGYEHVTESARGTVRWMADLLAESSGLQPVTIDQSSSWSPALNPARDPNVAMVMSTLAPVRPVVVHDRKGPASPWYRGHVDLAVYHPAYGRVQGRPEWWANDPSRNATPISFVASEEITLIQAYPMREGAAGTPADHALAEPRTTQVTLYLRAGSYLIVREMIGGVTMLGELTVSTSPAVA